MKSTITQIERRFDLSSSVVGLIDGSFEMGLYIGPKMSQQKLHPKCKTCSKPIPWEGNKKQEAELTLWQQQCNTASQSLLKELDYICNPETFPFIWKELTLWWLLTPTHTEIYLLYISLQAVNSRLLHKHTSGVQKWINPQRIEILGLNPCPHYKILWMCAERTSLLQHKHPLNAPLLITSVKQPHYE